MVDERVEREQLDALAEWRSARDADAVAGALAEVKSAAMGTDNLTPMDELRYTYRVTHQAAAQTDWSEPVLAKSLSIPLREKGEALFPGVELAEIVAGKRPGRTSADQITVFKSNGLAVEDIAVAGYVYEEAIRRGLGRRQ